MSTPERAWVGLGGNVGDAVATVRAAIEALSRLPGTRLLRASRLYRTPAWGVREQADFINAVVLLETSLGPRVLLDRMLEIERNFGRERRERWGPRVLDLDLLDHRGTVRDGPDSPLLPHPRLSDRAFVLLPLRDIAPGWRHPASRRTIAELLESLPEGQRIRRLRP